MGRVSGLGQSGEFGEGERLGPAAGIDARGVTHRPRALRLEPEARGQGIGWPKAARTTARSRAGSSTGTGGARRTRRCSTAESTWGGGRNAPGGTVKASRASQESWVSTDRLPYVLPPGRAATRSATSFWSISAISSTTGPASTRA